MNLKMDLSVPKLFYTTSTLSQSQHFHFMQNFLLISNFFFRLFLFHIQLLLTYPIHMQTSFCLLTFFDNSTRKIFHFTFLNENLRRRKEGRFCNNFHYRMEIFILFLLSIKFEWKSWGRTCK
jgi:hypothetical protein